MTQITFQLGKVVMRDGKVATESGCCCKCGRCIVDGEWDCRYTTQEQCEQCDQTFFCLNLDTSELRTVADCNECTQDNEFCYSTTNGPCGTWNPDAICEPCPCDENSDCPEGQYCCDGYCREPFCPTFRYYHISFHIADVPGPAGISKVCESNVNQLLLNPCGIAVITRAVGYGPFSNCTLAVSADIGEGCVLQNIVVTQSSGGACDDPTTRPDFIEIEEIQEADCQTVFIPD